jgi:hypothetical protein
VDRPGNEWNGQTFEDKGEIVTFEPERELADSRVSPMAGKPDVPENYQVVERRGPCRTRAVRAELAADARGSPGHG